MKSLSDLIKRALPSRLKSGIKYCFNLFLDLTSLEERDPLIPPRHKTFIGDGDFRQVGDNFLSTLEELTKIKPSSAVLDMGAGQGRMARPLTKLFDSQGSYAGVEIVSEAVQWCQHAYREHRNFQFIHADLFNAFYNPLGKQTASEYRFPFEDESFDIAFLTSVFTHMYPEDIDHYLSELSRCLKPGGQLLATHFLLTPESISAISAGRAELDFKIELSDGVMTTTPSVPEDAIAIDEARIVASYQTHNLELVGNIHYGNWVPRANAISFQDTLVTEKK